MTMRTFVLTLVCALLLGVSEHAQQSPVPRELGIKYMRDSEEYATLARQVYRMAGAAVASVVSKSQSRPWTVVLDVDETALDNSTYQLERAAYGLPYDDGSWSAWVERRRAPAVPGVVGFIELVRRSGGRVAWISNRNASLTDATRDNLKTVGLWHDDDRLCLQQTSQDPKSARRRQVITGQGDCSWRGTPTSIVAFVGDQLGDFPAASEQIPGTGDDATFGLNSFLLPNSMYGGWTTRVTRVSSGVER
jgi:acid phosphatase